MFLKKNVFFVFFFCFRHIFLLKFGKLLNYNSFNYSKRYFFICIKLWINLVSFNNHFIDLMFIINYNLLRFLEYSDLNIFLNIKFKSTFFNCSKYKSLVPFRNFKLKININLFLLTNNYLNFFRKFKYNEYLRKNDMASFKVEYFFFVAAPRDNFLFNFSQNHYLIFFSSFSNFNTLRNLIIPLNNSYFDLYSNFSICLFNSKFLLYFFKYLKRFIRIYFLLFSYNLFFSFRSYMRSYSSFRFVSLSSIAVLNKSWQLRIFKFLYKLIYLDFFFKNQLKLSCRFPAFLYFDLIFVKPVRQYFLIDYFSKLYHYIYLFIKFKFKNNKKRKFSIWRKIFIVFFRVLINFNNFDFINMNCNLFIKNLKFSLDFITWSIFSCSFNKFSFSDFIISSKINNTFILLRSYFIYNFHIFFISFVKFFDINNNYIYFFLINLLKDISFKYISLINSELNKKVVISNFYSLLSLKNKEYRYCYSKYLYSTKILKFDKYYKFYLNFYNE